MRALRIGLLVALPALTAAGAGAALSSSAARSPGTAAALHLVYHARADVDGDGRADAIKLFRHPASVGHIEVRLATGRRIAATAPSDAVFVPGLVTVGNVNGHAGAELFVDITHVTTAEVIGIYTYARGGLRLARKTFAYGSDYGIRFGITCTAHSHHHYVVQHDLELTTSTPHRWTRKDTEYIWQGATLKLAVAHPRRTIAGTPSASLIGVHCGHVPTG